MNAGDRPRVLIVNDDEAALLSCADVLCRHGYAAETATSGAAAVKAMREASFEAVLSDIDMRGMNGIALLEQVRNFDADLPVILMAGNPSTDTAILAMERGAHRYLLKPVPAHELVRVAGDAVQLHRISKARR